MTDSGLFSSICTEWIHKVGNGEVTCCSRSSFLRRTSFFSCSSSSSLCSAAFPTAVLNSRARINSSHWSAFSIATTCVFIQHSSWNMKRMGSGLDVKAILIQGTKGRFTHVPSHLRSICVISTVEIMEVGTYHFTWGPKSQVIWFGRSNPYTRSLLGT